jgi:hypothetical protein
MGDDQHTPDADHKAAEKTVAVVRLEALQKTLHHIEATNHILEVSGIRPEPLAGNQWQWKAFLGGSRIWTEYPIKGRQQ